ncbi:hypothetical protein BpHYR1_003425, partial [Brachionus plicatilis]
YLDQEVFSSCQKKSHYSERIKCSNQRNGHIDAQISGIGKQLSSGCVKDKAIAVCDRLLHTIMDGARRSLPSQASPLAIQLEPVGELLGLLARADQLNHGKKLLVALVFLLLFQNKHKVVAKARLHHDPVDGARQSDVCRQEHNVLALQSSDALVMLDQMWHHLVQGALPLARGARARTIVRPQLARVLVLVLLVM